MKPLVPTVSPMQLPGYGDADGSVMPHVGRYAREAVVTAFEMMGGVDRLADWASKNPTEFYTRLFPKVISREVELNAGKGIEDLLAQLDRGVQDSVEHPISDADYSIE